jgi:hypothetical protein
MSAPASKSSFHYHFYFNLLLLIYNEFCDIFKRLSSPILPKRFPIFFLHLFQYVTVSSSYGSEIITLMKEGVSKSDT